MVVSRGRGKRETSAPSLIAASPNAANLIAAKLSAAILNGASLSRHRSAMRRNARTSRWIRAAIVAVIALAAAGWRLPRAWMLTRLEPARTRDDNTDYIARFCTPGPDDATAEWIDALSRLTQPPIFDEPPPDGMRWSFPGDRRPVIAWEEATSGPWAPDQRMMLRRLIRHMRSAAFNEPLNRIVAIRQRGFVWKRDGRYGYPYGNADLGPAVDARSVREAARQLVSRARMRAEEGDLSAAWDDLETVLILADPRRQQCLSDFLVLRVIAALALDHLRLLAREMALPDALAGRMLTRLEDAPLRETWNPMVRGQFDEYRMLIDRSFASAADGGYLVLSAQPVWSSAGVGREITTSTLWNVFAPLYERRHEIEARVDAFEQEVLGCGHLPFAEGMRRLTELSGRELASSTDGAALQHPPFMDWTRVYQAAMLCEMQRRATIVMVGLARYAAAHGRYPAELSALAPQFLDRVPRDPFCEGPFGYLQTVDGYALWSCGADGHDDGGPRAAQTVDMWRAAPGDVIFTVPRPPPRIREPVAVPLAPGGSP